MKTTFLRYHMSYLTDGAWSPNRPGLFFTTNMDGCMDVWDYLLKQNEPTISVQVYSTFLRTVGCRVVLKQTFYFSRHISLRCVTS